MYNYNISGIQQVGIGVENLEEAWYWYAKHFGMDLPIFRDEAEANLMSQYTGGSIHKRKAVLAMNLQGGGGFEVWQYTSRIPSPRNKETKIGDLGISHVHLRTKNVAVAHNYFRGLNRVELSEIELNELNKKWFELKDPFGNSFKIIEDDYRFIKTKAVVGGVMGVTIGVPNLKESIDVYQKLMHYDTLVSKQSKGALEHVWLQPTQNEESAFSKLLGPTRVELVCDATVEREAIFTDRYWGDLGFIHVCFDVQGMSELRKVAKTSNYAFKVDSEDSFDMGDAAGQFAYIQDKGGTLIELVETHKVPIMKKWGLYINLKKKKKQKPLPRFIFRVLGYNRIK